MPTIDVQVHPYERNHPGRPWAGHLQGPPSVTGEELTAAMDAVGVDAAILVSPFSLYRYDASYTLSVYAAHPERFRVIKPVDPEDPAVGDTIAAWAATRGTVGVRLMLAYGASEDPADPGMNRVLREAARHRLPVNVLGWERLDQMRALIAANPETVVVIDHLGILQPFEPPPPAQPWANLQKVLELARLPNARVKISGACTLSHEKFPYADIWDPVLRIIDAYGLDRCMWGTDWTRAVHLLTYREGVEAFRVTDRLTAEEKAALMGGTLQNVYGWAAAGTK